MRLSTPSGHKYDLLQPAPRELPGVLIVAVHGFLERRRFPDLCRLHECARTAYPLSPYWRLTNWGKRHTAQLVETIEHAAQQTAAETVILAGHSDGTTPMHAAARELPHRVNFLIHWSGIWAGDVADCPALFVHGEDDRFGTVHQTTAAWEAYGNDSELWTVPGGHGWQPEHNGEMLEHALRIIGG